MSSTDAAWQHFADADWAAARDAFAAALEADPGNPEALDGLGQSLWWLGDRDAGIDRRRDAYAAYRRQGDYRAAGRLAVYLAGECRIDGQDAAAAGWMARAQRLLGGVGTVAELGWLAIEEAKRADDPQAAERHARVALEVAHQLTDADVECMALAQLGRAVVRQGRVWPAGTASPCSWVAASSSPSSAPPPTRTIARSGSTWIAFSPRMSMHSAPSRTDRPETEWPPARTVKPTEARRAARIAAATSSASRAKATAAGRRSIAPFHPARAES